MPGAILAVPGTNTQYATRQCTIHDEPASALWRGHWSYRRRDPSVWAQFGYTHSYGWWPCRSGFATDPAAGVMGLMSQDAGTQAPGGFEQWRGDGFGTPSQKFISGRCKDEADDGVSGAVVQGFLTATDTYVGETTADSLGYYEFGTPFPAPAQHYLVAYRAGSPDIAGTTVNTLTAANRDGT